MNYTQIMPLITTVGFPIVMCGAMGWFVVDQTNKHREDVSKLNDQHANEMNTVVEAINNNTIALKELSTKLTGRWLGA